MALGRSRSACRSRWLRGVTLCCVAALGFGLGAAREAGAALIDEVNVTYSSPSVVSGPLSLGLSSLPSTIIGRFRLEGIATTPGIISNYRSISLC